jgi:hypothetical protein
MTWPTKDDDSSSNDSPPTQSQRLPTSSVEDDEKLLEPEGFDDEPEVCIPLRMILIPTEEELNSSQMTPSSSFKSFNLHANHPNLRDLEQPTPFKSDFNADGSRAQFEKSRGEQEQLPTGFDTGKQSHDPKWTADPNFNYSFDMPDSSPPNSPDFRRKQLQSHNRSAKDAQLTKLW